MSRTAQKAFALRMLRAKVARAEQGVVGAALAAHAAGWDMEAADMLDRAVVRLVRARKAVAKARKDGAR